MELWTLGLRTEGCEPSSWPTATRSDGAGGEVSQGREGGANLRTTVWASPQARDYKGPTNERRADATLPDMVLGTGPPPRWLSKASGEEQWPTPSVAITGTNRGGAGGRVGKVKPLLGSLCRGLSARWVEALMGFPPGWTEITEEEFSRHAGPRGGGKNKKTGSPRAPSPGGK